MNKMMTYVIKVIFYSYTVLQLVELNYSTAEKHSMHSFFQRVLTGNMLRPPML